VEPVVLTGRLVQVVRLVYLEVVAVLVLLEHQDLLGQGVYLVQTGHQVQVVHLVQVEPVVSTEAVVQAVHPE
jgi:hypothetical protein